MNISGAATTAAPCIERKGNMAKKKNFRLTMKTVRALIKQELGLNLKPEMNADSAAGHYIYTAHIGNFELTISSDWFEHDGLISFRLFHNSGTVQLYFDQETLEEDFEAEHKYQQAIKRERCRGCMEVTVV